MPKVDVKDVIMFLKIFGISSLFFIAGIIICFIGRKHLNIDWPAYVIILAMLITSEIIILIIETIKYIKTNKKEQETNNIEDVIKKEDTK